MHTPKKILFVPLDWGLGHASRCIPLIQHCLNLGYEVIIGGNEITNSLLRIEFPHLQYLLIKGYSVQYSKYKWMLPLSILMQIPKLVLRMKHENSWLNRMIDKYQIDMVVSDNRYGLYSKKIPSFFITHQLQIQVPQSKWIQYLVNKINHTLIRKFTLCLVPDYLNENMAGKLSQATNLNHVEYIGNLSRFNKTHELEFKYDLLILLSGPEPQRSLLEKQLLQEISASSIKTLVVRGKPNSKENLINTNTIQYANHLTAHELQEAILSSKIIIARSGYSTVMDLIKLNKHAILIPTPGQTEQEYLAKYLSEKNWFLYAEQNNISVLNLMKEYQSFNFSEFTNWDFDQYKSSLLSIFNG